MQKDDVERIEALLIMLNKILYVTGQQNAGHMSAEVAMAEITAVVIGEK